MIRQNTKRHYSTHTYYRRNLIVFLVGKYPLKTIQNITGHNRTAQNKTKEYIKYLLTRNAIKVTGISVGLRSINNKI